MTFSAISYGIKPGHDEEIADIFSLRNFRRASSPVLRDESGAVVGRIIGTGLFLQGDLMIRIIQYDGDLQAVARHMAVQEGVRAAEQQLAAFLAVERDTTTVQGFLDYFTRCTMASSGQAIYQDTPLTGILAVRNRLRHSVGNDVPSIESWPEVAGENGARVLAAGSFVQGTTLLRFFQYSGDVADAATAIAEQGGLAAERALAGRLAEPHEFADPSQLRDWLLSQRMRCISQLSLAGVGVPD